MSATTNSKFDQVVQGNIDIKQFSKRKYKITFSEIHKFLKYQIWSDSSQQSNENRIVYYQKAKQWIQEFNSLNTSLKASNKPLFNPTTVMEIGSKKYLFVINKAKLNGNGHVVFKVSTKQIKLSDKKMLELPCGHHDGVRFDIDNDNSNKLIYTVGSNSGVGFSVNAALSPSGNIYYNTYFYLPLNAAIDPSKNGVIFLYNNNPINDEINLSPYDNTSYIVTNVGTTYNNAIQFISNLASSFVKNNIPQKSYSTNTGTISISVNS
jgi:hypothetical protein